MGSWTNHIRGNLERYLLIERQDLQSLVRAIYRTHVKKSANGENFLIQGTYNYLTLYFLINNRANRSNNFPA